MIEPSLTQYPGGVVPEGVNVGFLGEPPTSTGSLSQMLGATLQPNSRYTLRLFIGRRLDEAFTGYIAALQAGGVTLASDSSLIPAPGTFLEGVIVYETDAHPLQLGQTLAISLQSIGAGQVNVDEVSLTVQQR